MKNKEEYNDKINTSKAEFASLNNSMQLPQQFLPSPHMMFGQYGGVPSYPPQEFLNQQNIANGNSSQLLPQPILGMQGNPYAASLPQNYMMNLEMFHNMMRFYNPSFLAMQQQMGENSLGPIQMMMPPQQFFSQVTPQSQQLNKEFAGNGHYGLSSTNAEDNTAKETKNQSQNSFASYFSNPTGDVITSWNRADTVSNNMPQTDIHNAISKKEIANVSKHPACNEELDISLPTKSELIQRDNSNEFFPGLSASSNSTDKRKENQTPNTTHQDFDQKYLFPNKDIFEQQGYQKHEFDSFLQDDWECNTKRSEQTLEQQQVFSEHHKNMNSITQAPGSDQEKNKRQEAQGKKVVDENNSAKTVEGHSDKPIKASGQYNLSNLDNQAISALKFVEPTDNQEEYFSKKGKQTDQSEARFTSKQQLSKQKSFDETPINGKPSKLFEDLLEEQLKKNPAAITQKQSRAQQEEKRTFLKRGSRQFLSSAATRVQKKVDSPKENDHEYDSLMSNNTERASKRTKSTTEITRKPRLLKDNKKNIDKSFEDKTERSAEPVVRKLSQPRKFLAKGKGSGGGKGYISQPQQQSSIPGLIKTKTQEWKVTDLEDIRFENQDLQKSKTQKKSTSYHSSSEEDDYEKSVNNLLSYKKDSEAKEEAGTEGETSEDQKAEENEDGNSCEKSYDYEEYLKAHNFSSDKKRNQSYEFNHEKGYNVQNQTKSNERENGIFSHLSGRKPLTNAFKETHNNYAASVESKQDTLPQKYINIHKVKVSQNSKNERKMQDIQGEPADEELKKMVDDKIEALNSEIAKFKLENERIRKIRQRHEDMLKQLNYKIEEFERKKSHQEKEFEEWKKEEVKKIRNKEKTLAHKNSQVLSNNSNNRKDREETELLKEQLYKCQGEIKSRDQRNKLVIDRLKKQNEELNSHNAKLQQELRILKQREGYNKSRESGRTPDPKQRAMSNPNLIKGHAAFFKYQHDGNQKQKPPVELGSKFQETAYEEAIDVEDDASDHDKNDSQHKALDYYSEEEDNDYYYNDKQKQEEEEEEVDLNEMENYEDIINPNVKNYYSKAKNGADIKMKNYSKHSQGLVRQSQTAKGTQANRNESQLFEYTPIQRNNNQSNPKGNQSPFRSDTPTKSFDKEKNSLHESEYAQIRSILIKKQFGDNDFKYNSNHYYKRVISNAITITLDMQAKVLSQTVSNDGKVQRIFENGKKEIIFHNGVKKEVYSDGYTIVYFVNNDIKQTFPDGTIVYYFADANTTQTSLVSSTQIYRFANNQIEFHNSDGTKEIYFYDGTKKFISINTEEYTIFADGTTQKVTADKIKYIDFVNGQKDVIYEDGSKIRTFPDGKN